MTEYEIRFYGPTGRVAEVYVMGASCDACALTRARIITRSHAEFAGAEVRQNERILAPEIPGFAYR